MGRELILLDIPLIQLRGCSPKQSSRRAAMVTGHVKWIQTRHPLREQSEKKPTFSSFLVKTLTNLSSSASRLWMSSSSCLLELVEECLLRGGRGSPEPEPEAELEPV